MRTLPDVNVLVALAWPNHVHHEPAREWFAAAEATGWATTAVTEAGFVRVSSNPVALPEASSPQAALDVLRRLCGRGDHAFWPDRTRLIEQDTERLVSYRQVTDAHLLALAAGHDGALVTFDRGIAEMGGPDRRGRVLLLTG